MKFTKMQAAGNDFIVVEAAGVERDWPKLAVAMCHRHFGIGADGLLLILPSVAADFKMHMFNPDGSEAEACGNGLRCLAKYVVDKGLIKAQEISVETMSGTRRTKFHYEGDTVAKIQVGMGDPEFRAKEIPVVIEEGRRDLLDIKPIMGYHITIDGEELALSFVSMGNPHAVYFCQYPVSDFPLSQLGPKVEKHKMFPNRVNFEVARAVSRNYIEARVWERGVGETLACGSGACAVAVIAQLHEYVDKKVNVKLPGGILEVEWNRAGEVLLSGPTNVVFAGDWPE